MAEHVSRTPRPDCVACQGFGVIHFQVPGELRTERRECQCWRMTEVYDAARLDLRMFGTSIVRVHPDGRAERLPLNEVNIEVAKSQEKRA